MALNKLELLLHIHVTNKRIWRNVLTTRVLVSDKGL